MRTCATESLRKCQFREEHRIQKATATLLPEAWDLDWAVTARLTVVTWTSAETLTNKVVEIFTPIFQTVIKSSIALCRRTDQIVSTSLIFVMAICVCWPAPIRTASFIVFDWIWSPFIKLIKLKFKTLLFQEYILNMASTNSYWFASPKLPNCLTDNFFFCLTVHYNEMGNFRNQQMQMMHQPSDGSAKNASVPMSSENQMRKNGVSNMN